MISYYLAGDLGDVLLVESFYQQVPDRIIWSSRARPDLQPIFEKLYPEAEHQDLRSHIQDQRYVRTIYQDLPASCPPGCEDWSHLTKLPEIRSGKLRFKGSGLLANRPEPSLGDVVVIQADSPYNPPETRRARRFTDEDWRRVIERLEAENRYGVVLDCDKAARPPRHRRIIDAIGQTTIEQSVITLRNAVGYYGINSWLAVLACQLFDANNLSIKWHGLWYKTFMPCYCYPHKTFPFCYGTVL